MSSRYGRATVERAVLRAPSIYATVTLPGTRVRQYLRSRCIHSTPMTQPSVTEDITRGKVCELPPFSIAELFGKKTDSRVIVRIEKEKSTPNPNYVCFFVYCSLACLSLHLLSIVLPVRGVEREITRRRKVIRFCDFASESVRFDKRRRASSTTER